jgi:RNA polymerase sigma-54 factor
MIEEELILNPALEKDEKNNEFETNQNKDSILEKDTTERNDTDSDYGLNDEYFMSYIKFNRKYMSSADDKKSNFIEQTISREETLHEHLLWQLRFVKMPQVDFKIGEILVHYIDSNGYLTVPSNIRKNKSSMRFISDEFNVSLKKLEEVLSIIQGLDPPGVGARDIKECLLLQLNIRGSFPLAEKIINEFLKNEYLNVLKLKKYDKISKKLYVSVDRIKKAFDTIAKLEPYPGRKFYSEEINYVVPEVIVEKRDGDFDVISNSYSIPKLKVRGFGEITLRKNNYDKRLKKFTYDKINKAKKFINFIQFRESTLVRVMKKILDEQKDFFIKGPKYLKPMTYKDVSVHLDLHESTISRIASRKYAQTPFGVRQLKYFFPNPIPSNGDRVYSSTAAKEEIKDIIQNEGMDNHLNDQIIADRLAQMGMQIQRRTVNKYRKELNIF